MLPGPSALIAVAGRIEPGPRGLPLLGQPVKKGKAELPYRAGMPDGLDHIRYTGDALMLVPENAPETVAALLDVSRAGPQA